MVKSVGMRVNSRLFLYIHAGFEKIVLNNMHATYTLTLTY